MYNLAAKLHNELLTELREVNRNDAANTVARDAEDEEWLAISEAAAAASEAALAT